MSIPRRIDPVSVLVCEVSIQDFRTAFERW